MIWGHQGSSLLDNQLQPKLGHLEAPKRERLRTGKAAFELHGRQVATREAQSRRLGGGREVIGEPVAGSECVGQGPRRLIADPGTRIRGGKVTSCLGSEEEAHSPPTLPRAGGRGAVRSDWH